MSLSLDLPVNDDCPIAMGRANVDGIVESLHSETGVSVLSSKCSRAVVAHFRIAGLSVANRKVAQLTLGILLVTELTLLLTSAASTVDVYHGPVCHLVPFARHDIPSEIVRRGLPMPAG
jgi:hypothetical protein